MKLGMRPFRFSPQHLLIPFFLMVVLCPVFILAYQFNQAQGGAHGLKTWGYEFPRWIYRKSMTEEHGKWSNRLSRSMISNHNYFCHALGKTCGNAVVTGKNGWLFRKIQYAIFRSHLNEKYEAELRNFKNNLSVLNEYCAAKKLTLYFFMPPSKEYVYYENTSLPAPVIQAADAYYAKLQKITRDLGVGTTDLVSVYRKEKANHQIFNEVDHHWTDSGAFIAFSEFTRWAHSQDSAMPVVDYRGYRYIRTLESTAEHFHGSHESTPLGGIAVCATDDLGISRFGIPFHFERPDMTGTLDRDFTVYGFDGKIHFQSTSRQRHRRYDYYPHWVTKRPMTDKKVLVLGDSYKGALSLFLTSYFKEGYACGVPLDDPSEDGGDLCSQIGRVLDVYGDVDYVIVVPYLHHGFYQQLFSDSHALSAPSGS